MHFVPIKTVEQQSLLCVHRLREGFKAEPTACINRIRGPLAEFGLVFPQKPEALRLALPDVLEDASNELGGIARMALQRAQAQWAELDAHLAWCDERHCGSPQDRSTGRDRTATHGCRAGGWPEQLGARSASTTRKPTRRPAP